jgi:hypothetical protein
VTFTAPKLAIAIALIGPLEFAMTVEPFAAPVPPRSVAAEASAPAAATGIVLAGALVKTVAWAVTSAARRTLIAQVDISPLGSSRDELLNRNYLTHSGETVPHPGVPQIGNESEQEMGAQRRSDRDTHSICSNCD